VHEPDAPELVVGAAQQAIFRPGAHAWARWRADLRARPASSWDLAARRIRRADLDDPGASRPAGPAIYEASFFAGDIYAAVDILERDAIATT